VLERLVLVNSVPVEQKGSSYFKLHSLWTPVTCTDKIGPGFDGVFPGCKKRLSSPLGSFNAVGRYFTDLVLDKMTAMVQHAVLIVCSVVIVQEVQLHTQTRREMFSRQRTRRKTWHDISSTQLVTKYWPCDIIYLIGKCGGAAVGEHLEGFRCRLLSNWARRPANHRNRAVDGCVLPSHAKLSFRLMPPLPLPVRAKALVELHGEAKKNEKLAVSLRVINCVQFNKSCRDCSEKSAINSVKDYADITQIARTATWLAVRAVQWLQVASG